MRALFSSSHAFGAGGFTAPRSIARRAARSYLSANLKMSERIAGSFAASAIVRSSSERLKNPMTVSILVIGSPHLFRVPRGDLKKLCLRCPHDGPLAGPHCARVVPACDGILAMSRLRPDCGINSIPCLAQFAPVSESLTSLKTNEGAHSPIARLSPQLSLPGVSPALLL